MEVSADLAEGSSQLIEIGSTEIRLQSTLVRRGGRLESQNQYGEQREYRSRHSKDEQLHACIAYVHGSTVEGTRHPDGPSG